MNSQGNTYCDWRAKKKKLGLSNKKEFILVFFTTKYGQTRAPNSMEQMEVDVDLSAKPSTSSAATTGSGGQAQDPAPNAEAAQAKGGNVMAAPGTSASVTISLHPLVIMNISEHWTRFRAQHGEPRQVYGALIGKQKGRNIEIMNSFELKTDVIGDETVINKDYYNKKEQQYKQVGATLTLLGPFQFPYSLSGRFSVIWTLLVGTQQERVPRQRI